MSEPVPVVTACNCTRDPRPILDEAGQSLKRLTTCGANS